MKTMQMTRQPRTPRHARGMSLLELVIVIVLIGAVLAVVGSRLVGGKDRAQFNLAQTQLDTLAGKIEQYQLDTGRLPESLEQLVTSPGNLPSWLGPYAKAEELRDPWGNPIDYRKPGGNGPFELVSLGADGQPGGDSVNQDIRKP